MGKASRDKGKRGERDFRDAAKKHLHAPDTCRRGQQRSGTECADVLDVLPATHVEVKRYAKVAALRFLEQAERDAKAGELPVVAMREDGDTEWTVMLRLTDVVGLAERVAANMGHPIFPLEGR